MRDRLPRGLGGSGHWQNMLGGMRTRVNESCGVAAGSKGLLLINRLYTHTPELTPHWTVCRLTLSGSHGGINPGKMACTRRYLGLVSNLGLFPSNLFRFGIRRVTASSPRIPGPRPI